jgi:uncharacterized protein YdeI (BOF family)
MRKTWIAATMCALIVPGVALAQSPQGFDRPAGKPQGFELTTISTVAEIKKDGRDDQLVQLRGRFTRQVKRDKYEFVDEKGDSIIADLDDDHDWSHVVKDKPMEILAEIDKDRFHDPELEVIEARNIKK